MRRCFQLGSETSFGHSRYSSLFNKHYLGNSEWGNEGMVLNTFHSMEALVPLYMTCTEWSVWMLFLSLCIQSLNLSSNKPLFWNQWSLDVGAQRISGLRLSFGILFIYFVSEYVQAFGLTRFLHSIYMSQFYDCLVIGIHAQEMWFVWGKLRWENQVTTIFYNNYRHQLHDIEEI